MEYKNILEMFWKYFGNYFGNILETILELFWNYFGTILELFWNYIGIILEIILELFWNYFWIIFELFLNYFGIILEIPISTWAMSQVGHDSRTVFFRRRSFPVAFLLQAGGTLGAVTRCWNDRNLRTFSVKVTVKVKLSPVSDPSLRSSKILSSARLFDPLSPGNTFQELKVLWKIKLPAK